MPYGVAVRERPIGPMGSPFLNGEYDAARFVSPQGQRFPGTGSSMGGQYDVANFVTPQGQHWPGHACAKVVAINTPGAVNGKVVRSAGAAGMYSRATYAKAPFFAGTRSGMGATSFSDIFTPVTDYITANPGTSLAIGGGGILLLLMMKKGR